MQREGESCARSSVFSRIPTQGNEQFVNSLKEEGGTSVRRAALGGPGGISPPSLAGPVLAAARLPDALAGMVNLSSVLWNCEDDDAASQIAKNFAEVLSPAESRLDVD